MANAESLSGPGRFSLISLQTGYRDQEEGQGHEAEEIRTDNGRCEFSVIAVPVGHYRCNTPGWRNCCITGNVSYLPLTLHFSDVIAI